MPAIFAIIYICIYTIITVATMYIEYMYSHVFLYDEGNNIVERKKRQKYSTIKDVVVQYCQIQYSIKFESMCDFVV